MRGLKDQRRQGPCQCIIPLARHLDWEAVKGFSKGNFRIHGARVPERFLSRKMGRNKSGFGKIFIELPRNSRGASTVGGLLPFRARPGLPVSVPIRRDELAELSSCRNNGQYSTSESNGSTNSKRSLGDMHYRQRIKQGQVAKTGAASTKIMLGAPLCTDGSKDWPAEQPERGPVELTRWENAVAGWSTWLACGALPASL